MYGHKLYQHVPKQTNKQKTQALRRQEGLRYLSYFFNNHAHDLDSVLIHNNNHSLLATTFQFTEHSHTHASAHRCLLNW